MVITIDGLDGVGKSTLARRLSEELGFEYVDKPIYELFHVKGDDNYLYKEIKHIQEAVYDTNDSNLLKSYFTGLSLVFIKECMDDRNLVIDRGLLSAYAFNGDEKSKPLFELLINYGVFFDLSIVLVASTEERLKRLKSRNPDDPDLSTDKIIRLNYDSVMSFIEEHPDLPCVFIETDGKEKDEVFKEALEAVKAKVKVYKKKTIN